MPRQLDETRRQRVTDDATYRMVRKALEKGSATVKRWHTAPVRPGAALRTKQPHSWLVDYSGDCLKPVTIYRDGYALTKRSRAEYNDQVGKRFVEMTVQCRQCENCLRRRAGHWHYRVQSEAKAAHRNWFGTLTLSPEQHYRVATACRIVASRNGDDFDTWSADRQFAARHACISREITLYLKRVRKYSGSEFRFVCVVEKHKTGLPHYHMLVHEVSAQKPVRHAVLSKQWRVGFSNWKLVKDGDNASYLTKYLSKSMEARVRASLDYGNTALAIVLEENVNTPDFPRENLSEGPDSKGK